METIKRTYELPKDLYEHIKAIAEKERRSIAAQVIVFLQEAVRRYDRAD
jgi:hypothetical protein